MNLVYRKIMWIFVFIAFISLVTAVDPSYIFKQNQEVDLKVNCFEDNFTLCQAGTTCNITSFYPNNTILIENQVMTYNPSYFNHTINGTKLNELGEYATSVSCSGSYAGFSTFTFEITPTGQNITSGQGFTSIGLIIGMIILAGLFSFFGFKFSESEKLYPVALFFMLISLIVGVYAMQVGYVYSRDVLFPLSIAGMQFKIFLGIMWGLIAMAFLALMWMIFKTLGELKARKSIIKDNRNSDGFYDKK